MATSGSKQLAFIDLSRNNGVHFYEWTELYNWKVKMVLTIVIKKLIAMYVVSYEPG